jgi:hypothetical protein
MVECDYCAESFEEEQAYLAHLEAAHEGELSNIDARRVEGRETDQPTVNVGVIVLGVMIVAAVGVVGYIATVGLGGSSGDGPGPTGSAHEHGTMTIMIDGEPLNLAQDQYIFADKIFHLDGPEDQIEEDLFVWHTHAEDVDLEYALETFGMEVASDGSEVTFQGRTYSTDDPDTELQLLVNGESVTPGEYELSGTTTDQARQGEGDYVRVVLNSTSG